MRYTNYLPNIYTQHRVYDSNDNPVSIPSLSNVKYPPIPLDPSDIYVYTNRGDRYDLLANVYYEDSSLWWIISIANSSYQQDSIIPPIGKQIRIPNKNRTEDIIESYKNLNSIDLPR